MNDQNAIWTFHDLRLRSPDDLDVPEWRAWMIGEAHKLRIQGEITTDEWQVINNEVACFNPYDGELLPCVPPYSAFDEATPEELAAEDERHEREEAEAEGRQHKSKRRYLRR